MGRSYFGVILYILILLIISGCYTGIEQETGSNSQGTKNENNASEKDMFPGIPKLHWDHMPLKFLINEQSPLGDCSNSNIPDKVRKTFQTIENGTDKIVYFEETDVIGEADIILNCVDKDAFIEYYRDNATCIVETYDYYKNIINVYGDGILEEGKQYEISVKAQKISDSYSAWEICYFDEKEIGVSLDYFTVGDALPDIEGDIINKASINLYKKESISEDIFGGDIWTTCGFPAKSTHEILHSFGFGHPYLEYYGSDPIYATNVPLFVRKDIMAPIINCALQTEIQEKYYSCLKYIYSNGEQGNCDEEVVFLDDPGYGDYSSCEDGWYLVEGTDYCCPGPNMEIVEDMCV
jgi:hypothetical protein